MSKQFIMFLAFVLLVGNILCLILDGDWIGSTDVGILQALTGMKSLETATYSSIFTVPYNFLTTGFPKLITWDFSFLQGSLGIIRWFLFIISIGAVWAMAILFLQAFQSIFSNRVTG